MTKVKFPPPNIWLSIKECKVAYAKLAQLPLLEDPLPEFERRDPGKLEGILGAVAWNGFGIKANKDLLEASVSYFIKFIKGHPFPNGNKRSAILFTDIFLYLNGYELQIPHQEMYALAILVAKEQRLSDTQFRNGVKKVFRPHLKKRQSNWLGGWPELAQKWWRSWQERGEKSKKLST